MSQKEKSDAEPPSRPPVGAQGEEDFAALLAASEAEQLRRPRIEVGDVVRGRVIAVGQSSAFVAIGGKDEAVIDLDELRDPQTGAVAVAVGDAIEATVIDDGQRSGSIVLRRSLGRGSHLPSELEQALQHRLPVEGLVTGENKGGFDVQIGTSRAFCPFSQIDLRRGPERAPAAHYIGQRLRFYVTKIEAGGRNIVLSRRDLLQEESAAQAARTWESLQVGAVLDGVVTSVRDFGAFVDLGGVEGLIHISEMGYGRIQHPSEMLSPGQPVRVQVIKLDPPTAADAPKARRQVGLSLKALAKDPWDTAVQQFAAGSSVRGTVRRVEAFGAFVELAPGLEGLVHISKLALDRRIAHARQVVSVGQAVDVTVLSVDPAQRRISLSLVEQERQARDAAVATDKQDQQAVIEQTNQRKSFGSFADILAASESKRRSQ
jgi:small subunit ribosomal protein S1